METTDKQFFVTFLGVTAALVIIAIVVFIAANVLASGDKPISQAQLDRSQQRIEPVGQVRLKSELGSAAAATATVADRPAAEPKSPQEVYETVCQACHAIGLAGAPKLGDKAAWAPRIAAGTESLYAAVIKGKNAMPPRGGAPDLSDAELKAAVDYMVKASR